MAVGVAVANAICSSLSRSTAAASGADAIAAAVEGGTGRLRPILMTSMAMMAGMVPMALALGEGGEQTAPWAGPSSAAWRRRPSPRCCAAGRICRRAAPGSRESRLARSARPGQSLSHPLATKNRSWPRSEQEHTVNRKPEQLGRCRTHAINGQSMVVSLLGFPGAGMLGCGGQIKSRRFPLSLPPLRGGVDGTGTAQGPLATASRQPGRIEPFRADADLREDRRLRGNDPCGNRRSSAKRGDVLGRVGRTGTVVEAHHAREALVTQARLGVGQAERSVDVIQASLSTAEAEVEVAKAAREKTSAAYKRWGIRMPALEQLTRDKVDGCTRAATKCGTSAARPQAADKEAAARIHGAEAALGGGPRTRWPSRRRTWPPRAQPAVWCPRPRSDESLAMLRTILGSSHPMTE